MDEYTRKIVDGVLRVNLLRMVEEYRKCKSLGLFWATSCLLLEIREHLEALGSLTGEW